MRTKQYSQQLNVTFPDLSKVSLSGELFYGIFVTLSIIIAGLLYGAEGRQEKTYPVAAISLPDMKASFRANAHNLVDGYPIERMLPSIERHNKLTASFLVSIAKKESNWGKRVPRSEDGKDCYNYWGYRGAGSRGIAMGHGCFSSPEEAVETVGKRIGTFIREYHFDTPDELIVWKCGFSCVGHSPVSVKKWIADVDYYFDKVYP